VALVKAFGAFGAVDIFDRSSKSCPAAGVLGELGIGSLEEDLDTVERCNNGFGL
jgi:hypothetical protein